MATGNNAASKLQPLTRSKTADASPNHTTVTATDADADADASSISPKPISPSHVTQSPPADPPFRSAIYCSRDCAQADAGRSSEAFKDLARTLSYDFTSVANEHGIPVTDRSNPFAPPSPLFISGSDSSSNPDGLDGPALSAPNTLEYFRMFKDGPDDAWHSIQRQRRSSVHPAVRPIMLTRQRSTQSSVHRPWGDASSDSLSSMWNSTASEAELHLARSTSTGGALRGMTPLSTSDRDGVNRRAMSSSSERSAPVPTRLPRSSLSQTSLAASPGTSQPISEHGSVPNHTLSLLSSYAAAFPVRDPLVSSTSYSKGSAFPGSGSPSTPAESRRGSANAGPGVTRPVSGTIRAKSRSGEATWDSFGKEEVEARAARNAAAAATAINVHPSGSPAGADCTPKQSLEVEDGRWKIKYFVPGSECPTETRTVRSKSRSFTRSSLPSSDPEPAKGIVIPTRPKLSSSVTSTGQVCTPQATVHGHMPPPASAPPRPTSAIHPMSDFGPSTSAPTSRPLASPNTTGLPDLASLRLGAGGCARIQRSAFSWADHERRGGKTYELPQGLKIDRSKAGLFYFN